MIEIANLDSIFGPTCASPSLPLALDTFDLGALNGFVEATAWANAQSFLCLCADGKCSEEISMKSLAQARRTFVEEKGKLQREGVLSITNSLQSHNCLSAAAGVELFKNGFACGFVEGLDSELIIRSQVDMFMKIEGLDEITARERVRACNP